MKVSKLVGLRFKEKPADCVIDSHALMVRGGYMKYVGNGIYSEFPTLRRVTAKIEKIIREEIELEIAIDNQALYWNAYGSQRKLAKNYYKQRKQIA